MIGAPFQVGACTCRIVEDPEQSGFRQTGYVDCLIRRNHTGWCLEDDGLSGETARGVVFQLPARKRRPVYVAGSRTSYDDKAAAISLATTDDLEIAAAWADQLAENAAEPERDYQRAANAGLEYSGLGETIADTRRAIIRECGYARQARRILGAMQPSRPDATDTVLETLAEIVTRFRGKTAETVRDRLEEIGEARKRREIIRHGDSHTYGFDRQPGFREAAGLE